MKSVYVEADRRAKTRNTDKGLELLKMLELRLDNVVYVAGLTPSRGAARQAVTHGHILVNGKKLDIPSLEMKEGDTVELKLAKLAPAQQLFPTPTWLDRKGISCKVVRMPVREDIDEGIKENLIIEFYSR